MPIHIRIILLTFFHRNGTILHYAVFSHQQSHISYSKFTYNKNPHFREKMHAWAHLLIMRNTVAIFTPKQFKAHKYAVSFLKACMCILCDVIKKNE